MTGFAGRIFFEGDADEAKALLGDAIKLADTLRAWKTTQRINNVTKVFNLRDGAYLVVADLQNMRAMQIVTPVNPTQRLVVSGDEWQPTEDVGVMDVMSGVVTSPTIVEATIPGTATSGSLTYQVDVPVDALQGFTPTTETSGRYSSVDARRRLAVEEDPMYRPINAPLSTKYSVHAHVKPSCFSGAMRKVAQLLLGVGRPIRPMWEQKWMKQEKKAPLEAEQKDGAGKVTSRVTSPYGLYYAKPALRGRDKYETPFKFDYRFAKTHGISFDQDDRPWLIEISSQGVHAMPLYLDAVSTTDEGRARYLEVSPELEEFFDEFGGMPLGICFPSGATFQRWKRAGEIVELLDDNHMSLFYENGAFGTDVGWSFNSVGSEAHNCCTGVLNNLSTGMHYRIKINLNKETFPQATQLQAQVLNYVRPTELYALNKIRRMTEAQASALLRTFATDRAAGLAAFDSLVVTPSLVGTASLELVNADFLYHPAHPRSQPQIKFPDSIMGGLVSFDFGPHVVGAGANVEVCDAPMFVCHIDDEIEVINYFADFRSRPARPAVDTREVCQFTGNWTTTTYGGAPRIAGNFYTSRWDWREEITPNDITTTYTGRKIGVQGQAKVEFFFTICVDVMSYTHFTIKYTTTAKQNIGRGVSVAIPFHARDCYYMARHDFVSNSTTSKGQYNESTPGPQRQAWKLFNFVWHWYGLCGGNENLNPGGLRCIAKKYGDWQVESCVGDQIPNEIYYAVCPEGYIRGVPITVNAPYWNNGILGSAVFPPLPLPSAWSESVEAGVGKQEYEIRLISDTGLGEIITESGKVSGKDPVTGDPVDFYSLDMSSWWWRFSPDPDDGSMPWMGATYSCLGNPIINFHSDMDAMTVKSQGVPSNMHAGPLSCYVGVIR